MKSITRLLLCSTLTISAFASDHLPLVRSADIGAILQSGRAPIEVTKPATSSVGTYLGAAGAAPKTDTRIDFRGADAKEINRLAALPVIELRTNNNPLGAVIRSLCENAGMNFFIASDDSIFEAPVTLSGTRHPWEFLKVICSRYGLDMNYQAGIWNIFPVDNEEPVLKSYVLKNNTLEKFTSGNGGGNSSNGSANTSGNNSGTSGSTGNGSQRSGRSGGGIDRSGQSVFQVESSAITDEVTKFLDLPAGTKAVLAFSDGSMPLPTAKARVADGAQATSAVTFNPGTNTLTVFCSRAKHAILEKWLSEIDRPQKLIHIETKFLLTSVNPTSKKGFRNPFMEEGGLGVSLSGLKNEDITPGKLATWAFPKGILTASDLNARVNLLEKSSATTTVQYPQLTTLSGQEVVLRSVKQVPISSANINNSTGGGTTTTSELDFVDVGTIVSILPKVLNEKNVLLNISITISSISGYAQVNGSPVPLIDNQTYTDQVIVENGYSLVLGGLEQVLNSTNTTKTPWLADLPFFGFLGKDVSRDRNRSVLNMVVTPTIFDSYRGGNQSGIAQFTVPVTSGIARPVFDGNDDRTLEAVDESLKGFARDVDVVAQKLKESRADGRTLAETRLLLNELELLNLACERLRLEGEPVDGYVRTISGHRAKLRSLAGKIPSAVDAL